MDDEVVPAIILIVKPTEQFFRSMYSYWKTWNAMGNPEGKKKLKHFFVAIFLLLC